MHFTHMYSKLICLTICNVIVPCQSSYDIVEIYYHTILCTYVRTSHLCMAIIVTGPAKMDQITPNHIMVSILASILWSICVL